jgi:hypothetical protein
MLSIFFSIIYSSLYTVTIIMMCYWKKKDIIRWLMYIVACRPVPRQWICKHRPLLDKAHNRHVVSSRGTVFFYVCRWTIVMQCMLLHHTTVVYSDHVTCVYCDALSVPAYISEHNSWAGSYERNSSGRSMQVSQLEVGVQRNRGGWPVKILCVLYCCGIGSV